MTADACDQLNKPRPVGTVGLERDHGVELRQPFCRRDWKQFGKSSYDFVGVAFDAVGVAPRTIFKSVLIFPQLARRLDAQVSMGMYDHGVVRHTKQVGRHLFECFFSCRPAPSSHLACTRLPSEL